MCLNCTKIIKKLIFSKKKEEDILGLKNHKFLHWLYSYCKKQENNVFNLIEKGKVLVSEITILKRRTVSRIAIFDIYLNKVFSINI